MISIDLRSPTPPYEQIRAHLAHQITHRSLAVGTRLPTVRRLAADLDLAVNTVARAYRELETAGLIETRGRAGTFVAANGDHVREQARVAAVDYADTATRLGLSTTEALQIVRAALTRPSTP